MGLALINRRSNTNDKSFLQRSKEIINIEFDKIVSNYDYLFYKLNKYTLFRIAIVCTEVFYQYYTYRPKEQQHTHSYNS